MSDGQKTKPSDEEMIAALRSAKAALEHGYHEICGGEPDSIWADPLKEVTAVLDRADAHQST
jgi:hypothetical protein